MWFKQFTTNKNHETHKTWGGHPSSNTEKMCDIDAHGHRDFLLPAYSEFKSTYHHPAWPFITAEQKVFEIQLEIRTVSIRSTILGVGIYKKYLGWYCNGMDVAGSFLLQTNEFERYCLWYNYGVTYSWVLINGVAIENYVTNGLRGYCVETRNW